MRRSHSSSLFQLGRPLGAHTTTHDTAMCRMMVFAGSCTKCGEKHTWDELTQNLSCLEAKNNCAFGDCSSGVEVAEHEFDQECDNCTVEDEGVENVEEREEPQNKKRRT
ncbi:hypothetical protein DL764_002454 [Monosporascus ibericus]|uniref:Uncharacterized protein n=1 Tax=Monosporascus ibericus TaxID=155417 RepID=A0A4Q4TKD4_9PEZI|nr:hypothetical protein DL764_002454 [Monosporascus ibericus]